MLRHSAASIGLAPAAKREPGALPRLFSRRIHADGLEEETVGMLLFGDTVLFIPPVGALPTSLHDVEVLAAQGANLRAEPNTESRVIKPAIQRTRLKAVRRSEDGEWIQIYIDPVRLGWVSQTVITGNLSTLQAAEPQHAGAPLWFPLQSFRFPHRH